MGFNASEFKEPVEKPVGKAEMQMAKQLIQSMTAGWKPEQYTDEYAQALEKMIEDKIEHGGKGTRAAVSKKTPSNVVDLISILQQSIRQTRAKPKAVPVGKTKALYLSTYGLNPWLSYISSSARKSPK